MSGWRLRPGTVDDHADIAAIIQAQDIAYLGRTDFSVDFLREQLLADSGVDPARDVLVAEQDSRVVAAGLRTGRQSSVSVMPEQEDPQLRREMIAWAEARQRELGWDSFGAVCDAVNVPAVAAWTEAGYELERFFAQMIRDFAETGAPEPASLPDGYRIRNVDPVADAAAMHELNESAFAGDYGHEPQNREDYTRGHLSYREFDPGWSLLVEAPDGQTAGATVGWRPDDHPHGYILTLAVAAAHRRRGLARALLLGAFAAIHAAGLPTAELYVASDNARALDLYTGVGMRQGELINNYRRGA